MCFSSTCAMAAAYLKPGCLAGASQLDDRYLGLLQRHGDTTDAAAQIQTLRSLGIQAELRTDGRIEQLIAQLRLGIPVPAGWLHKGPVAALSGGGHLRLVVGWDLTRRAVLMHDPNGQADLFGGGYVSTAIGSGRNRWYSERKWCRRWMVEGVGSCWWLELAVYATTSHTRSDRRRSGKERLFAVGCSTGSVINEGRPGQPGRQRPSASDHRHRSAKAALQLAAQSMGAGHRHIAELLDRLTATADGLGDALVAIGLDAIGIDVHDQAADFAAGSLLIAMEEGAWDATRSPGRMAAALMRAPAAP